MTTRLQEIAHYTALDRQYCGFEQGWMQDCGPQRKATCKALRGLLERLYNNQRTDVAKDRVRESMFDLNRCRAKFDKRFRFYGIGA